MKIILLLLLFAVNVAWPHEQLTDNKVSFSYEKIDLKDLFEVLAHTGGVHFIGYKSLEGTTDLIAQDVTWKQAFEMVLRSQGLHFIQNGNMIWVAPIHVIKNSPQALWDKMTPTDINPQQVFIEANIVEVDHRFSQQLGFKLGLQNNTAKNALMNGVRSQLSSDLKAGTLNKLYPSISNVTMISKHATQIIQAELNAIEATGVGKIVSNPKIVTTNQVAALIEQGTDIPYVISSKDGAKVHFRKANLRLEVIPEILPDHILLDIEIYKDSLGKIYGSGPSIHTRHIRSKVMVEDGGAVMIGGIYIDSDKEEVFKVPFLGDIPILGRLFQHKETMNDKTELLIFLTPTLIDAAGLN
jgi:type IV pilus assembly protein PilQ